MKSYRIINIPRLVGLRKDAFISKQTKTTVLGLKSAFHHHRKSSVSQLQRALCLHSALPRPPADLLVSSWHCRSWLFPEAKPPVITDSLPRNMESPGYHLSGSQLAGPEGVWEGHPQRESPSAPPDAWSWPARSVSLKCHLWSMFLKGLPLDMLLSSQPK